jgi:hypothetical protein
LNNNSPKSKCKSGECSNQNSAAKSDSDEEENESIGSSVIENNDLALNTESAKNDEVYESDDSIGENLLGEDDASDDAKIGLSAIQLIAVGSSLFVAVFLIVYCILKYRGSDQGTYSIDEKHGPFAQLEPLSKTPPTDIDSSLSCSNKAKRKKNKFVKTRVNNNPNKEWFV